MRRQTVRAGLLIQPPCEIVLGSGVLAVGIGVALLRWARRYRDDGPVGGYPDLHRRDA